MTEQYSTWRDFYLAIQGLFYLAQGIAYGAMLFFVEYLRIRFDIGTTESIVMQAIILFPWYIKVFFGLLSDNVAFGRYGRRKPYIFLAAVLALFGWVTLPLYNSFSYLIITSALAVSLGIALSDASIDALAVDITPPQRRGAMQGVSWGSRGLGFGLASFLAGQLIDQGEWLIFFIIPGILTSLTCFLVLIIKEVPLPEDFKRIPGWVYSKIFRHRAIQLTILFQILSGAGITIISLLETFVDEELQYSSSDTGLILMYFAFGMLFGAILFGFLGDRLQIRITLPFTTVLYIVAIAAIFVIEPTMFNDISIYFAIIGFINGGYEATQMRLGMDYSPSIIGGTMFNLYNSLSNIGQFAIGSITIALLIPVIGLEEAWQLASLFLVLAIIPALVLIRSYDAEVVEGIVDTVK